MRKPPKLTDKQLSELFRRFDKPRSKRERECAKLNADLSRAIGDREIKALYGVTTEYTPIVLSPSTGPGKHLSKLLDKETGDKSLAGEEQGRSLGASWRRVVEMGCHTEATPKAIGRYQEPETVLVTTPYGVVSPKYRNQGGDPLSDHIGVRKRTTARLYREEKRKFRKVVTEMTTAEPEISRADNMATLTEANERTTGDYRRYFR